MRERRNLERGRETQLERTTLEQITTILTEIFQNESCQIYLFGSRQSGTATATSDFDLGVLAGARPQRQIEFSSGKTGAI